MSQANDASISTYTLTHYQSALLRAALNEYERKLRRPRGGDPLRAAEVAHLHTQMLNHDRIALADVTATLSAMTSLGEGV